WLYDENMPFEALKNLDDYASLKEEISKTLEKGQLGYFEQLVKECFLDNKNAALVCLIPQKGLAAKNEKALADQLASYKSFLSKEEISRIVSETKALLAFQQKEESPEDLKKLPTLKRKDLKRRCRTLSNIPKTVAKVPVVYHETVTNGIGYVSLYFDLGDVPVDFMPELSLLTQVLGKVDTATYPYQELDSEIGMHTGTINFGLSMYNDPENEEGYRAYLSVRMKAIYDEMSNGFELIRDMLLTSDLDNTVRLKEILVEARLRHQMKMQHMGHLIAAARCSAYQNSAGVFSDQTAGVGFYEGLKKSEEEMADCPALLSDKLKLLVHMLVTRSTLLVSYTSEKEGRAAFEKALKTFVDNIPKGRPIQKRRNFEPYGLLNEAFTTAGQVQFVAKHGEFNTKKFPFTGSLNVLRHIMNYDYLWQNIRVTGGAYGCGATFTRKGDVTMRSYRDPHLKRSVNIYKKAVDFIRNFDVDEETMTKFIIGTIGGEDTPMTPSLFDTTSMAAYMNGLTTEERQKNRDQILDCTPEDIRALADYVKDAWKKSGICVVGSESAIEKDKHLFKTIRPLI
ncbi:MAG: insulinase family protein, partial [Lachnospiraceae bacterium]|nr:insulinase family protein [Candidatus Equihabitans merdae]